MSLTMLSILIISILLMIISFIFSLQANVWIDALYRSFIVSIASFVLLYIFIWVSKKFIIGEANTNNFTNNVEGSTSMPHAEEQDSKQENRGKHIDFQTPDDEEFIPFQPKKITEDEWKKKERDN